MRKNNFVVDMIAGLCFVNCIVSCNSSVNNQDDDSRRERYAINFETFTDGFNLSQYSVDSICSLNIPDDIMEIGTDKISIVNGRIYILDKLIGKKLYAFDCKGNLKVTIGERGHARGEYIGQPDDFFVDRNNKLHVFDRIGNKIIIYNEDGSIDDVVETNDLYSYSFGLTGNDKYIMYFSDGYRNEKDDEKTRFSLLIFDKDYKNVKKLLPTNETNSCFLSSHTFFQDTDRLSFIPPFSDSVIVFKDDNIEKVVQFDFGGKNLIKEQPKALKQDDDYSIMNGYKGVLGITRYQETESLVYLQYNCQHKNINWLYDKRNGQIVHGSSMFEGISPYTYYNVEGNQIIAYIDEKVIELFKQVCNDKIIQEKLKKSPGYIKDFLDGKIQAPALVYITIK